jgi:uncharacterized protein YprB with RNaseH-like and TPR domain
MIESTFVLLKGIGEVTERRLWSEGTRNWRDFIDRRALSGISAAKKSLYDAELDAAGRRLAARDARFFRHRLKSRDHWRLYETFKTRAVYLDIETTGGSPDLGDVTVVGLFAEGRTTSLVSGESLSESRLRGELARYDLLVTFFGSVFDLPFLAAKFPSVTFDQPHIDLCFAARRLGLRGGLKSIESQVGISRGPDLKGLDGWDAVRLWQQWQRGDAGALDLLLRYNEADVRNLEPLAEMLVERLTRRQQASGLF